jgi:hypothetical protein
MFWLYLCRFGGPIRVISIAFQIGYHPTPGVRLNEPAADPFETCNLDAYKVSGA